MSTEFSHQNNIIGFFAQHKVAANLLMIIIFVSGFWALSRLNTQFFPNFALDIITVRIVWSGASAEDVETAITRPVEQQLRTIDLVHKITSTSARGVSSISIEYKEHTDIGHALDQVQEQISLLRNLPKDSEKPEISRVVRYDSVARLLITGMSTPSELRHLARRFERELLERGIGKIAIVGLPDEEIAIQIPSEQLEQLGLSLPQVAKQVTEFSKDTPAGSVGRDDIARQLRSVEQRRSELEFQNIPIQVNATGKLLKLDDIAEITRRPKDESVSITYQGKPAIEFNLQRVETADALASAKIFHQWLDETRLHLPKHIELIAYDETWELINERINLLINNGAAGLFLVLITLFLFMNARVAFWVAWGIPTSFMGMFVILYLTGGSINMISLFAMIMASGMIVDDAIVVGEDAFTHYQTGEDPLSAAEGGGNRMFAPVIGSFLTTVATFLPLMVISGVMGNILIDIPLVMIFTLLISQIECFFILPAHLRHTFHIIHHEKPHPARLFLENSFNTFRDVWFRPIVTTTLTYRWSAVATLIGIFILTIGLFAGGRMNFTFFPSPEGTIVMANAKFIAGTPPERVAEFLQQVERQMYETQKELGTNVIKAAVVRHGASIGAESGGAQVGDQFGSMLVELISPDKRKIRNTEVIQRWRAKIQPVAGLENFIISERRAGPPGRDIEIRLYGDDLKNAKAAALEITAKLETYPGVSAIEDDMPFGQEEWLYSLTPQAEAMGLTVESVGQQLRAAYDGLLVQIFQDGDDEVEVRVVLPDEERHQLARLEHFTFQLPNGDSLPLSSALSVKTQRGFQALRHAQWRLAVQVGADVAATQNNANNILQDLQKETLPRIAQRYGVTFSFEGRSADQRETLRDMQQGLLVGLLLIFIVLAWEFGSYVWPIIVMIAIPFGLMGAIFGHWLLGLDVTLLSLFGFFGLSGIVVNDSIVLVSFYREAREQGVPVRIALTEAACQRLRAVLMTSLTTIFGLLPMIFEKSLQAQFLIPMAVSISFGLMFSTLLVLLAIPALLSIYEGIDNPATDNTGKVTI